MNRTWIVLSALVFLAACGEEQKPYQPPLPHSDEKAAAPQLFQPQREALDKAKGLEQSMEQGAKAREEAAVKAVQ
jgi:hypothetical protein